MNWYSIHKSAMALPIMPERNVSSGYYDIDERMREDTAKEEAIKNPDIKYLGSGFCGIACDIGGGKAVKYTVYESEANMAKFLMENEGQYPTVKVYDVQLIQDKPRIWAIVMEKVQEISNEEVARNRTAFKNLIMDMERRLEPIGLQWDVKQANMGINKEGKVVLIDLQGAGWQPPRIDWQLRKNKISHNWYEMYKISMALPIDKPSGLESGHWWDGINAIDEKMDEETANKEKSRLKAPSFLGSGVWGVVLDIGDNMVVKYTTKQEEADMARFLMQHGYQYPVVKVYDVKRIQDRELNELWAITMEKLKKLDRNLTLNELRILETSLKPIALDWDVKEMNVGINKNGRIVVCDLQPDWTPNTWRAPAVNWDAEDEKSKHINETEK